MPEESEEAQESKNHPVKFEQHRARTGLAREPAF
jgi:hypothetical protein